MVGLKILTEEDKEFIASIAMGEVLADDLTPDVAGFGSWQDLTKAVIENAVNQDWVEFEGEQYAKCSDYDQFDLSETLESKIGEYQYLLASYKESILNG